MLMFIVQIVQKYGEVVDDALILENVKQGRDISYCHKPITNTLLISNIFFLIYAPINWTRTIKLYKTHWMSLYIKRIG